MKRFKTKRCASGFEVRPTKTYELHAVFPAHRENRRKLDRDFKHLALLVVEIEQLTCENQVAGAGNRQEFGQAFDHAEDECFQEQQEVHV